MTLPAGGSSSATTAVEAALARIDEADGTLHAFAVVDRAGALEAAATIDRRLQAGDPVGPLAGVTVAVKDMIAVRGLPLSQGSPAYRHDVADSDAAVVERLRQAGAVIIGTATCHELAYGPTGDVSYPHVAVNPRAPGHVPGGSSSGSAVATAAGLTIGAIGSDTGGSTRIPAACCGIAGLKPTRGLVSTHGMRPLAPSLDHVGVFARSVHDVASIMAAVAEYDARDEASRQTCAESSPVIATETSMAGARIGVLRGHFTDVLDPEVEDIFRATIETLRHQGAEVTDVDVTRAEDAMLAQRTITAVEARRTHLDRLVVASAQFGAEVRGRLEGADGISLDDYLDARRAVSEFRVDLLTVFGRVDVLACPTLPILPPRVGQRRPRGPRGPHAYDLLTRFTSPFNTVDVPAISVPMGWSSQGLPIGIQLVAEPFGEHAVYRVAAAVESHVRQPEEQIARDQST